MVLPDTIHCVNSPEMTVLERQRTSLLKWQQDQGAALFQQQTQSFYGVGGGVSSCFSPGSESFMGLGEVVNQCNMIDPASGIEYWGQQGKVEVPAIGFGGGVAPSGYEVSCGSISGTASCPTTVVMAASGAQAMAAALAEEKIGAPVGKERFNKRKLERAHSTKGCEDDARDKKIKGCSDELESKITEQSNNNSNGNKKDARNGNDNNKETSVSSSKDNSKASEVQKPDYIHVRARRGQATDSHSLAERVRREKISERMKFLQDLVPGCHKITGKAGMLDEIINYVQSLQRQVEFLSMKLAAVNPRLDFDIDSLFQKEVNQMIPTCTSSFPTMDMSPELTNPAYLHFDPMQQVVSCSTLDMGIINPDMGIRRTSGPVPVPDPFIDSSCFPQIQPGPTWDTDFQNLYNMEFQQGRATATTTYQSHQQYNMGPMEATNMKMEI
ncbi:hypothetical protein CRG98_043004 [Punica granatum]|nr:hypothetical protein CRG98_043004 [Punica granatum]